jgi:hypothetical protein
MPAASPSARTIAISPIVVLSPAFTISRAYQNAGAGLKMEIAVTVLRGPESPNFRKGVA